MVRSLSDKNQTYIKIPSPLFHFLISLTCATSNTNNNNALHVQYLNSDWRAHFLLLIIGKLIEW